MKAQEAVNELNLNARFGRMELAGEFVAPKAKELFFERRKAWGGKVRVADYEVSGIKMTKILPSGVVRNVIIICGVLMTMIYVYKFWL